MKAVSLISVIVCAMALNSCCCQSQPMPPLRPMPKNLGNLDAMTPAPVCSEPVKVFNQKGK